MKPSKEQIEAWSCAAIARSHRTDNVTALYARIANFAYAAGRKAGMEEAEALARGMFNRAANGDEIADAIRSAMEAEK